MSSSSVVNKDDNNQVIGFDALKIMQNSLPSYVTIDEECVDLVNDQVQDFIRIIYSHARSFAIMDKRGDSVNGSDITNALVAIGMENHAEALQLYLDKYKDSTTVSINSVCNNSNNNTNNNNINA